MWANFVNEPISSNVSRDLPLENILSVEKKICDAEIIIEKNLSLESDADFQSFLLPLEQDFTKSSKGYASLVVTTPENEMKSVDYEKNLEGPEINNLLHKEKISVTDYLRNNDNIFVNYSCSSDQKNTSNSDNLCYEKCTKITQLKNVEDYQYSRSMYSKTSFTKIILKDDVSNKNENTVHLKKSTEAPQNFSGNSSNLHRFNVKHDDDDNNSESSETDSFFNGSNNSINFDDYSSSDDSVIFSEDVEKWCQTVGIKETSVYSSKSNTDYDSLKDSKENATVFLSENFALGFSLNSLQDSSITVNRNAHDLLITYSSEGCVNAGFEDDDFLFQETSGVLKTINESWNEAMKNISEEPHISKKVSFVPLPDLVSIYSYEPEDDNYRYSLYVLDQLRFQNRIKDFESIISPYLTAEHRASIYQRNCHEE